jgi:hypothetical protein
VLADDHGADLQDVEPPGAAVGEGRALGEPLPELRAGEQRAGQRQQQGADDERQLAARHARDDDDRGEREERAARHREHDGGHAERAGERHGDALPRRPAPVEPAREADRDRHEERGGEAVRFHQDSWSTTIAVLPPCRTPCPVR